MSLKLKRDETSINAPAANQLEVGELVMNSKTGILYTKLSSGTVMEFIGKQVCYAPTPIIMFDDVSNFCCNGDTISVKINGLEENNQNYIFNITELTSNSGLFNVILPASYRAYSNNGQMLNEATVLVSGSIAGTEPITFAKFSVELDNKPVTEKTISVCCKNCTS